jgi:hypothetical protein
VWPVNVGELVFKDWGELGCGDEVGAVFADIRTRASFGYYERRIDTGRKTRDLVRQLEALGRCVTLVPVA